MGDLTGDEIGAHRLEYLEACLAKRWQVPTEDIALLIKEVSRRRAAQAASAEGMWTVVRGAAAAVLEHAGISEPHRSCDAESIADRVAAQLTDTALSGQDIATLRRLRADQPTPEHDDECDTCVARRRALSLLDRLILAAHRAPTPTIEPLPEVIGCGTPGCMSSIKKHLLPAGWLLRDGRWLCPRCKVIETSGAS